MRVSVLENAKNSDGSRTDGMLGDMTAYEEQIAELVGISDSNYFSRIFKKHTGHSPGFYR